MKQRPSELFEGENSSFKKTFDAATSPIQQDGRQDCIHCEKEGLCKLHKSLDASHSALETFKQEGKKCMKHGVVHKNRIYNSCVYYPSPEETQENVEHWENGGPCKRHDCKICHPIDSSDWKEKERALFAKKSFLKMDTWQFTVSEGEEIADYWLSRIEPLLDSARAEAEDAVRYGGKLEERARLIALAEDMKNGNPESSIDEIMSDYITRAKQEGK